MWTFVEKKDNDRWIWAALYRRTRQIVGWCIGDRSILTGYQLREGIDEKYKKCETVSDLWHVYEQVFDPKTHTSAGKKAGLTNHIERFWNQLRQRLGRLVRKTLSFSKSSYWLTVSLWLFIEDYNRAVSSLL